MRVKVIQGGAAAGSDPQDTVLFVAIDPAAFRQIGDMVFVSGQGDPEANWDRLSQGSSLFVSSVVADEYDLKQGDTLLQTQRASFVMAAVTTFTGGDGDGMVCTGAGWCNDRFSVSVDPNYMLAPAPGETVWRAHLTSGPPNQGGVLRCCGIYAVDVLSDGVVIFGRPHADIHLTAPEISGLRS
jgi:hypothetical protein